MPSLTDVSAIVTAAITLVGLIVQRNSVSQDLELYMSLRDDARDDAEKEDVAKLRTRVYERLHRRANRLDVPSAVILLMCIIWGLVCAISVVAGISLIASGVADQEAIISLVESSIQLLVMLAIGYMVWNVR